MGDYDGALWRENSPASSDNQALDYFQIQNVKQGVRKRWEKGHKDFSDATVGGEHIPGCGVLGIEFTADPTAQVVAGGTDEYRGHGLVWACDGSSGVDGAIWCSTAASDNTVSGTWREVLIHPDQQWGGKDVTWTGIHQFDASVDMTKLSIYDDLSILGHLACGSNADITGSLYVDSSCDVSDFRCYDCSVMGDLIVDGTAVFCGDVDISADLDVSGTIYATSICGGSITGGYVATSDTLLNDTAMTAATTWQDLDTGLGKQAFVFLQIYCYGLIGVVIKPKGYGGLPTPHGLGSQHTSYTPMGLGKMVFSTYTGNYYAYTAMMTDSNGILSIAAPDNTTKITVVMYGYIL